MRHLRLALRAHGPITVVLAPMLRNCHAVDLVADAAEAARRRRYQRYRLSGTIVLMAAFNFTALDTLAQWPKVGLAVATTTALAILDFVYVMKTA